MVRSRRVTMVPWKWMVDVVGLALMAAAWGPALLPARHRETI